MKIRSFLAVAALAVGFAACKSTTTYRATDATVVVTPAAAQSAFVVQYPGATNVVWTEYDNTQLTPIYWDMTGFNNLDGQAYIVHFDNDNQSSYALYDMKGYWAGTAYVMTDFTVMPTAVSDVVAIRYPGYTTTGLSRVTLPGNRMAYDVELKKWYYTGHILIDDEGNVIAQRSVVADHI